MLYLIEHNAKFKRIDIAVDDYEGEHNTLSYLLNKILNSIILLSLKAQLAP